MKKLNVATLAAFGLAMSLSSVALAAHPAGSTFVRGAVEYSGHSLDDLKSYQQYNNTLLAGVYGLPANWENVGAAPGFDLELAHQFSPKISAGISFSHVRHSRDNSSAGFVDIVDEFGNYLGTVHLKLDQELAASISEITANVTFWVPGTSGLFVGAQAGLAMGDYKETYAARATDGATSESLGFTDEYKGSGFAGGAFAGYDLAFSSGVSVFAKAGYRLRDLGKLKGHSTPLADGEPGSHEFVYEDLNGNLKTVGFDFSGLFASAGLGFSFGGAAR